MTLSVHNMQLWHSKWFKICVSFYKVNPLLLKHTVVILEYYERISINLQNQFVFLDALAIFISEMF